MFGLLLSRYRRPPFPDIRRHLDVPSGGKHVERRQAHHLV